MSPRWTKDERFVIAAYEMAMKLENPQAEMDRYKVGESCSLSPKAVDTICNLLAQANFIKKTGKVEMFLTPHGIKLAERLRSE